MNWIYPDVIESLKLGCKAYLREEINVKELQNIIYNSEIKISSHEEKWLREMLFISENGIELSLFTLQGEELKAKINSIVKNILLKLN